MKNFWKFKVESQQTVCSLWFPIHPLVVVTMPLKVLQRQIDHAGAVLNRQIVSLRVRTHIVK